MSDSEAETGVDVDEWRAEVQHQREQKDEFFADHPQSPIPPEEREAFDGLDYFDPDPDYRVEATVTTHDEPDPVEMETTNGPNVRYLRVVTFDFEASGETQTLAGYRQESDDSRSLFVPFRDKTTGQQTYRGGRYMEFEPNRELEDDDEVVLDFNLAYSPFCAYSETFACPLPPEENWLDVVIPAGERFGE
ncbi:DUF1684 domain-containing protein [Haloprofundus sp. MHR1]|uniref:DUF1684 domain-containing protein n=1 Tax=Haloprofundus sp. MHR1 TaxID=2572921 RepID=UPI0010BE42E4|nr:DUF1684 domain-containing protein [Haloprofundus sp. MHR1]QCJ46348.1 DUF1684 domain-containing protein [Haloprofundus sp. MHR1]